MKKNKNTHEGSSFDNFLKAEGTYEECTAVALKRVLAWQFADTMEKQHITKKGKAAKKRK